MKTEPLYSILRNYKLLIKERFDLKIKMSYLMPNIKENKKYKDCHKGDRCFVIGNGPSLKEQDLSMLANEYVFTVNQITRNPQFPLIKTNYHFWADSIFFSLSKENPEDLELLENFLAIRTKNNNPVCFLPSCSAEFVREFSLQDKLNIQFYSTPLNFFNGIKQEIDFSKPTYGYQTVVQWAIAMAIYMGFSEIYIIGCDTTGIINSIEATLEQNITQYVYVVSENEKRRMQKMTKKRGLESEFLGWGRILHLYAELHRYCNDRGIKLINCSAKTIIDSIPKEKYENVIKMEYKK